MLSLLLLVPALSAADLQVSRLPWSEVGFSPAAPDAMARGPEQLSAASGGRIALYNPVDRDVVLIEGSRLVLSFPVRFANDLLLLDGGVLVLDTAARHVALWSLAGELQADRGLPDLVPTPVGLALDGDQVYTEDLLGNHHPVATLYPDDLNAPRDTHMVELDSPVHWSGGMMSTSGMQLPLPGALRASGQRFGDWLVVDEVLADDPIQVERRAWHVPSGQSVELPVAGRVYAPHGDLAATPEGQLVVLVPRDDGLEILRVAP